MGRHAVASLVVLGLVALVCGCGGDQSHIYTGGRGPDEGSLVPTALSANRDFKGTPRKVRLRVYADHEHRVQSRRWAEHFQEQVDLANEILIPEFGIELEVVDFQKWTRQAPAQHLSEILEELEGRDSGADVDWVVGLASALSSVSTTMHELGVARPLGRHLVLRGYSDIAERKLLGDGYKEELFAIRKRHKQVLLLLHEWAHTLGAIHLAGDTGKLMNPYYSKDIDGFSVQNANIIRAVLDTRLAPPKQRSELAEARVLRRYLENTPHWQGWMAGDYQNLRTWLDEMVASREGETQDPQPQDKAREGIPKEARQMYQRVRGLARAGKLDAALAELDTLIEAYPAHTEFREAACELWLRKEASNKAGKSDGTKTQNQGAEARCKRIAELDPGNPAGDLMLARTYVNEGRLRAAHELLAGVVERTAGQEGDDQKDTWTAVLSLYQAMRAVTWAEAALSRAPALVELDEFRTWAVATRRRYGLPPTARRHKISPEREGEYLGRVRAVLDLVYGKKYNEAKKLALQGLKTFPNAPGLLGALCDLELRMRHFSAARGRCARALAGHEEASWPRYLMGIIELRNKRNKAGIKHLEKAIAMDPDLRQAYHALFKAYQRVKDKDGESRVREAYKQRFGTAIPSN